MSGTAEGRRRPPSSAQAAEIALFAGLFASIAEEMGVTLARTAYSPNIKERRDFSCAVFTADGMLLGQAAHIPVHLGALPASVAAARRALGDLHDGDVVILNDPFAGGTHLPDITMLTPYMHGRARAPAAYLVSRAHHADVGGATPGSLPLATTIQQEGLRLPPQKLYAGGRVNQPLMQRILASVRTPHERAGDLRAQLAAHAIGGERMEEAHRRYGVRMIREQADALAAYGRRIMQSLIATIPDGVYRFEDVLDGDGIVPARIPIRVTIAIRGKRAKIDFTGSARACSGNLNAVEPVTRSAVYYCFLALLATPSAQVPKRFAPPPINGGCFEPLEVVAPRGSIVNATEPAAVAGGNVETSQRIVDVVLGALAPALPDLIPAASAGSMSNLALGGTDPRTDRPFAYYETTGGGTGAHASGPGTDGIQSHMTNTMNTPAEALEYAYPLRVLRYEIARGTGGHGKHRGGSGLHRDLAVLCEAEGSLLTERREIAPYGLAGGGPGRPGRNRQRSGRRTRALPGKVELKLAAGDQLLVQTPGGGGWGRSERSPARD